MEDKDRKDIENLIKLTTHELVAQEVGKFNERLSEGLKGIQEQLSSLNKNLKEALIGAIDTHELRCAEKRRNEFENNIKIEYEKERFENEVVKHIKYYNTTKQFTEDVNTANNNIIASKGFKLFGVSLETVIKMFLVGAILFIFMLTFSVLVKEYRTPRDPIVKEVIGK